MIIVFVGLYKKLVVLELNVECAFAFTDDVNLHCKVSVDVAYVTLHNCLLCCFKNLLVGHFLFPFLFLYDLALFGLLTPDFFGGSLFKFLITKSYSSDGL